MNWSTSLALTLAGVALVLAIPTCVALIVALAGRADFKRRLTKLEEMQVLHTKGIEAIWKVADATTKVVKLRELADRLTERRV